MTRCLGEKAFLMLSAGGGNSGQRLHLKTCELCSERYERVVRELEVIASTLRQEPPAGAPMNRPILVLYKAAPIVAALLFAVVLIWGESRLLHSNLSQPSAQLAANDLSDLIEQVSEALFPAEALGQTEFAPAGSDLVSVQNALGENCSAYCLQLLARLIIDPKPTSEVINP
jgi:hypothetical protein